MISGADNAGHDHGIDKTSCSLGTCHLEDDGERGGCRRFGGEIGVGIWDVETDKKDGKDIEDHNAPEDVLDDTGKILRGVLGLSCRDSNTLSSTIYSWLVVPCDGL